MSHMVHALAPHTAAQAVAHLPQNATKALPAPTTSADPAVKRNPKRRRKRVGSGENGTHYFNDVANQQQHQMGYPVAYVNYRSNSQQRSQPFRRPNNGDQRSPSTKPISKFCWFHDRFGVRALKCIQPCVFVYPPGVVPQYNLQDSKRQTTITHPLN